MRLLEFENKRELERLKSFKLAVKSAVAELFGAASNESENDDSDGEINEEDVL
jgi:hypothetical protein